MVNMDQQIESTTPRSGRRKITDIRDLITPDQQQVLDQDLLAASQTRIRAAGALAVNQDRM